MRKIALDQLNQLFAAIAAQYALYLPVDTKAGAQYLPWQEGVQFSEALNTVRSPKDFFFPQTENLMDFKMEGKKIEILDTRKECEDFVLFGVRACDVRSFDVLDRVFLADPVDSYYQNRREHYEIKYTYIERSEYLEKQKAYNISYSICFTQQFPWNSFCNK